MTGGAGESPLTCTKPVEVHVVVDGHVQQVVTVLGLLKRQVTDVTWNIIALFARCLNVVEAV